MFNWGALAWGVAILAIVLALRFNAQIASMPSGGMPPWRRTLALAGGAGGLTAALRAATVGLALLVQIAVQIVLGRGIRATLSASATILEIGIIIGLSLGVLEGVVLSLWHTPLRMSPRRRFATILGIGAALFAVLFAPLPIWLPAGTITGLKPIVTGIVPVVAGGLAYGAIAAFLVMPGVFASAGSASVRLTARQHAWRVFWLGTLPPAGATLVAAMAFALINGGVVLVVGVVLAAIVFFAAVFAVPSFFLADWLIARWNANASPAAPLPRQQMPTGGGTRR